MHGFKERYPGAALITGASAGLGESFAKQLAAEGMDLALVARRADRLESLAESLRAAHGVRAEAIALDLGAPDCGAALKAACDARDLQVSFLVNNAGFGANALFQDCTPASDAAMIDLNCRAPVLVTHAFLAPMLARGNGAIINVSSTAAFQALPYFAVYAATKTFDLMWSEALWAELRPQGIDVLTLCPGYTRTEFQEVARVRNQPPSFLWAGPDEVAATGLRRLGRGPTAIHGWMNALAAWSIRLIPRRTAVYFAGRISKPVE